jgi:hypothetical protein
MDPSFRWDDEIEGVRRNEIKEGNWIPAFPGRTKSIGFVRTKKKNETKREAKKRVERRRTR